MKWRFVFIIIIFVLQTFVHVGYASIEEDTEGLDKLADQSLQFAKVERREEAEKLLLLFSDRFMQLATEGHPYSMDEINIITVAEEEALKALRNEEKTTDEVVNELTRFRLAVDAIHNGKYPLWTGMKNSLMTSISQTKSAIEKQDSVAFQKELNHFLSLYNILYPAIKVDVTPERFQSVDAHVKYIDQYRPQVFSDQSKRKEFNKLEGQLKDMFNEMEEDDTDPSLWWVIISTGSIIIMTLSYVGWKKFKGNREKVLTKKKNTNI